MYLSGLIFLPLLFAAGLGASKAKWLWPVALTGAVGVFAYSLGLFFLFDPTDSNLQLVERWPWVPSLGVGYFVGVDGISFWLVLMTSFLLPVTLVSVMGSVQKRLKPFLVLVFVLQGAMLGTFLAWDAVLFFVFFEASVVPVYFLIGVWGGGNKLYAAVKFFIYTMAGSVFLLASFVALMFLVGAQTGELSASFLDFYRVDLPFVGGLGLSTQNVLFWCMVLAFGIKLPLFPLHTWLPAAHVEAPTAGSVILAGVLLKMGGYGFLRLVLPVFPEASMHWSWLLCAGAVVAIVYGASVAMVQGDIKKLVAYSSVSHMGYVCLGVFSFNTLGLHGGLYQMLNHGLSTGALFLLVGYLYNLTHTRTISSYGGLAEKLPRFSVVFFVVAFSSIAVPLTGGFVGEFFILLGAFKADPVFGTVAVLGVVLGAGYTLWMAGRVFFGPQSDLVKSCKGGAWDFSGRQLLAFAPIVVLIFWMGIKPGHFLQWSQVSVEHLAKNLHQYSLGIK